MWSSVRTWVDKRKVQQISKSQRVHNPLYTRSLQLALLFGNRGRKSAPLGTLCYLLRILHYVEQPCVGKAGTRSR